MNLQHPALAGLQPVDNGTLGQRVYNELRDYLMVGGVQPGEKVTLRQTDDSVRHQPDAGARGSPASRGGRRA